VSIKAFTLVDTSWVDDTAEQDYINPSPVGLTVRLNAAGHQHALDQPALSATSPFKILSVSSNSTGNLTSLLVKEKHDPKALSCLHLVNVISGGKLYPVLRKQARMR
jgi:hypothetical protein